MVSHTIVILLHIFTKYSLWFLNYGSPPSFDLWHLLTVMSPSLCHPRASNLSGVLWADDMREEFNKIPNVFAYVLSNLSSPLFSLNNNLTSSNAFFNLQYYLPNILFRNWKKKNTHTHTHKIQCAHIFFWNLSAILLVILSSNLSIFQSSPTLFYLSLITLPPAKAFTTSALLTSWARWFFVVGNLYCSCGMFNSTLGLYLPDAGTTPPPPPGL